MISISLEPYKIDKPHVVEELEKIVSSFQQLFVAVIAHGSVGSNEIIKYSDFDGLLIVKDAYKNSLELRNFIKLSLKVIWDFDPLQHHGWFVMYESQLMNYPQSYLPYEILYCSKLIFPFKDITLHIDIKNQPDYRQSFVNLTKGIEGKISLISSFKTAFQLKGFLSQVMLLPAMFLAAVEGKGVDKKQSFKSIQQYFSADILYPITVASDIRMSWNYKVSPNQAKFLNSDLKILKVLFRKYLSDKMTEEHKKIVSSHKFKNSLKTLINILHNEIDKLPN